MIARLSAGIMGLVVVLLMAADTLSSGRREAQTALKPFAGLVGDWRGTGQPQRGVAKGSWTETAGWIWKLTPDTAALELTVTKGKFLHTALLHPGKDSGSFVLDATLADGSKRTFTGKAIAQKPLVLVAVPPKSDGLQRVTLTPLHDTRLLVLLEARNDDGRFYRLAEVGYTRQGVDFAAGDSSPLCIVTEGRGTTQVSYQGKSYWVCCSGCKDLFNENPAAILAEAAERSKAKSKK